VVVVGEDPGLPADLWLTIFPQQKLQGAETALVMLLVFKSCPFPGSSLSLITPNRSRGSVFSVPFAVACRFHGIECIRLDHSL
jgi:hypothetical protein